MHGGGAWGDLHEAGAGDEKCLTERLNGRRGFNIVRGRGGGSMEGAVSTKYDEIKDGQISPFHAIT